jgi:hypothetical protein
MPSYHGAADWVRGLADVFSVAAQPESRYPKLESER